MTGTAICMYSPCLSLSSLASRKRGWSMTQLCTSRLSAGSADFCPIIVLKYEEQVRSIILVVPDLLDNAGQICQVDLLLERLIGSLGRYDNIVDHVTHLHAQLTRLVDVLRVAWVGFRLLAPLLTLLVPFSLVLHQINIKSTPFLKKH